MATRREEAEALLEMLQLEERFIEIKAEFEAGKAKEPRYRKAKADFHAARKAYREAREGS